MASCAFATSATDPRIRKYSVTIDQLLSDTGGVGQTRKIVDPKYPNANGNVTWVASDPLRGKDPGGKARFWARYPDGSGGFWRRDDWKALSVGAGKANAISLDWIAIDEDEDVSAAIQELLTQYVNGAAGNVLSIKGPEDVSGFVMGDLARTGDGRASAWYWYRPTTNKCIVRTKPYRVGTEDLLAKTWINQGKNRWSTAVAENVGVLRTADPVQQSGYGSSAGSGSPTKGPWLQVSDKVAKAVDVNAVREWHYGAGRLTVYAKSNPSKYFATGVTPGMAYFTQNADTMDIFGVFTNFHKVYIEGGTSFRDSRPGLEFRGHAGGAPWTGGWGTNAFKFVYVKSRFRKAGSFCTFLAGISEVGMFGIRFEARTAQVVEKVTVGGTHMTRFHPGNGSVVTTWWHYHKGDSAGDSFRNLRPWGETGHGWDGSVSKTGATNDNNPGNIARARAWPQYLSQDMNNFHKVTGHAEGSGVLPFIGKRGAVQLGESLEDPLKITYRGGSFGIDGDYATYSPNGRPVYFDDRNSAAAQFAKSDTLNVQRGDIAFLHLHNPGIVDFDGNMVNVDVRKHPSKPKRNVLNVTPNPADLDLGYRNPWAIFEVTVPEGPNGNAGVDLKLTGPGQGRVAFGEIDERYPFNWSGYWTIHGDVTDNFQMTLEELIQYCTVSDFNFTGINYKPVVGHIGQEAITIKSPAHFIKPNNNTIGTNVTLGGNRKIQIGGRRGQGRWQGPYKTMLTSGLAVTGTPRTFLEIAPFRAGQYNEGHPITIIADGTANWDANMVIDNPGSEHSKDVYFSDDNGTTWYEVPWTKGGSNTTKSAPPDLIGLNYAYRTFRGRKGAIYMPQFFADGNHCTVVLWFNGDPGKIKPPAGFKLIAGASNNLADGSLYVRAYERTYATGKDCWNEVGTAVKKTFSWTKSVSGWGYSTEHTGQNATPIGNAASTAHNTASTTHTAPTISASANSMIMSFIGMPGNAGQVRKFGGRLSPWMVKMRKDRKVWGNEGTDGFRFDADNVGVSFCAAEIYSAASGSKAGCAYTIDENIKAITTSIEIKT